MKIRKKKAVRDFSWMIGNRSKIQTCLNDLYSHAAQHHSKIERHKIQRKICGLLIGATFSLWRAVFIVRPEDRNWKAILIAGQNFLEKVIETNAIGFSDENHIKNRTWAVGYYLNNARFRAEKSIKELLEAKPATISKRDQQSLQMLLRKLGVGISEEQRNLMEVWDETYDAVEIVFRHMKSLTQSKSSRPRVVH